jgi:hypothetical protein
MYNHTEQNRAAPRLALGYARIPGALMLEGGAEELRAVAMDVSRSGMGIALPKALRAGATIRLITSEGTMLFVVKYCRRDAAFNGVFRCGLEMTQGAEEQLLRSFGCESRVDVH